ncbi:hypothetical protein [Natrinema marinum]|uniref:hypothetical protein n=1 Tax=Natrinema marinum TaxID=2961598 RepID=UPI0020C92B04|nr:hypothetical protein [Natrinema marinum]
MHALQRCDFCGADAAGAFEIVPPELEPTEAEQRRVVLCLDCKERLEVLIDPLLARAGAEHDATADERNVADGGSRSTSAVVAAADDSTQSPERTPNSNATVSEPDTEPETDAAETAAEPVSETAADAETEGDSDAETGTDSSGVSLLEEGITFEHGDEAADTEVDADAVAELVAAADEEIEADETDDDEHDEEASSDAESTDAPTSPPSAYGKVVRLLRNREFPMQRRAVEELAAGAYDLEDHEVEAVVDYAIEDGEFVEEREMLERP